MDQERKERIARNETHARDLNERFGMGRFLCECGDLDCTQIIRLPVDIYKSVRTDDRRFLIVPGHALPQMEDVVVERPDWAVVRKHDEVAHVVEG
ncbi:MAG: hypothetical protein QOF37_225 [Thermoleophilaceae bacterium]|nr:hypothetical protein [Thermoleophilaceae bacterium]